MNEIVNTVDYKEKALEYLRAMGQKLPDKYATQFLELCQAYGLNPFKRECYAVGYGDNWNIITGYEVYLKRAERTGKLDGWACETSGAGQDMMAELTIHRKDWSHPFRHYVLYNEAVQRRKDGQVNAMWAKMPAFMLRKVCIAQGFRLCFPDELGGMPYTADELPAQEMRDVTPRRDPPKAAALADEAGDYDVSAVPPELATLAEQWLADENTTVQAAQRLRRAMDAADESKLRDVLVALNTARDGWEIGMLPLDVAAADALKTLLEKYGDELNGNAAAMETALREGSDGEVVDMVQRAVLYLSKKGILVCF